MQWYMLYVFTIHIQIGVAYEDPSAALGGTRIECTRIHCGEGLSHDIPGRLQLFAGRTRINMYRTHVERVATGVTKLHRTTGRAGGRVCSPAFSEYMYLGWGEGKRVTSLPDRVRRQR